MATTLQKQTYESPIVNNWSGVTALMEQVSLWFWFCLSFVLFVVLGPFSAPVALIVLAKLGLEESSHQEPESISVR
jgi:hypothetical protein